MSIYKMNDGNLWLHSVVALNHDSLKKLESFGKPTVIILLIKYLQISILLFQMDTTHLTQECFNNAILMQNLFAQRYLVFTPTISFLSPSKIRFLEKDLELMDMPRITLLLMSVFKPFTQMDANLMVLLV